MAKSLLTEAPAIFSADGKAIEIGDKVYGVDTDCSEDRVPHVEPLIVTQLDLGPRRQVRLRRKNGTELVWTAQEHRGTCRTSDQFIYKNSAGAKKAAVEAAQEHSEKLASEAKSATEEINSEREAWQREIENRKKEAKAVQDKLRKYRNRIAAIEETVELSPHRAATWQRTKGE